MAKNPIIYNNKGIQRYIDYVEQLPDFLKGEDDVVVLLQVLSDYLNNAYRNISVVEKFEFKFIAIESNLGFVQNKVSKLVNLFKEAESRSTSVLFLSEPQANPHNLVNSKYYVEYITFNGSINEISSESGILSSSIITTYSNTDRSVCDSDKYYVNFTMDEMNMYSGVYYYDNASVKLIKDPYSTSQDPFTDTPNEPILTEVGYVPRMIEFNVSNPSSIYTRKATTVDGLVYYNVYFTATISDVSSVSSVESVDYDINSDGTTEDILVDYYNSVSDVSGYDRHYYMKFSSYDNTFSWSDGYGKGLFYVRELTENNVLSKDVLTKYTDPIFASCDKNDYNIPFYSKLETNTSTYNLQFTFSEKYGVDSVLADDVFCCASPVYDMVSSSFNSESDIDLSSQSIIVSNPDDFIIGDYITIIGDYGTLIRNGETIIGSTSKVVYKIIDKPIIGTSVGLKLENTEFISTGSGTSTIMKVNYCSNENEFNTDRQEFVLNTVDGLSAGDILFIIRIPYDDTQMSILSETGAYRIEYVDAEHVAIRLDGVRNVTSGSNVMFAIIKLNLNKNIYFKVKSSTFTSDAYNIIMSYWDNDVLLYNYFVNLKFSLYPLVLKKPSSIQQWICSSIYTYVKGTYVCYKGKRYRVLKTHKSGTIQIYNSDYFSVDMTDIVIYDEKNVYNPYMNGMYAVKSLDYSEEPDYSVGFDSLYCNLYVKKIQDLDLKYGYKQRQFMFNPRIVPSNIIERTGFMEVMKGNGDYDAVNRKLDDYVKAITEESILLIGSGVWTSECSIKTITVIDNIVTVVANNRHEFKNGIYVTISGVENNEFNGRFKITIISPTSFSYYLEVINPVGSIDSAIATYDNIIRCSIESINLVSNSAIVVTNLAHGYNTGITVNITGAGDFNVTGAVITVIDTVSFSYSITTTLPTEYPLTSDGMISEYVPLIGDYISVNAQYNGSDNGIYIVSDGSWSFYDQSKISEPFTFFAKQNLFDSSDTNPSTCIELDDYYVNSIECNNYNKVTVLLYEKHNYVVGSVISISGISKYAYNGKFEIIEVLTEYSFIYMIKNTISPTEFNTAISNSNSIICKAENWYKYVVTDISWQGISNYTSAYIGNVISNISGNGTIITIHTSLSTDFDAGDHITITNTDNYNGNYVILNIVNPTTFTLNGVATISEVTGNVFRGLSIASNNYENNVETLNGEYEFMLADNTTYKFIAGNIIQLNDQYLSRENGIYRVRANRPWTRLDKKLSMKTGKITIDAVQNTAYDATDDNSVPYIYNRYTDIFVDSYIGTNFSLSNQIYKIDENNVINYSFVFEYIENMDTSGSIQLEYDSRYDYNTVSPRNEMKSDFVGVTDMTYSLADKIERIAYLKDPDVIDFDLIEYLARYMGYDITDLKSDIDESVIYSTEDERNKALRETIKHLPQYYELKGTKSALEMLLLTFGIVGELVVLWTRENNPYDEFISDYEVRGTEIAENMKGTVSSFVPTPHFKIKVSIESNFDNQLLENDTRRINNQIRKFKPINTVFDGIYSYLQMTLTASMKLSNMRSKAKFVARVGFDDVTFNDELTNDCLDGGSWNIQTN